MSFGAGTDVSPARATSADEPVAVIGMACRLPGADGLDPFWHLLVSATDATSDAPPGRWEPADPALPAAARRGGFLADVDSFDPAFFGLSPAEAAVMDPRQRLMLELAWEAFEDAGVVPASCAGLEVGVFVGAMGNEHAVRTGQAGLDAVGRHTMTGEQNAIIANRVSYVLGLTGPSLTVDTGQSSSLAAVHLACESLRRGESILAVAGGVTVALLLSGTVAAARFGGLSPTGRCRAFDADADGFARGEGGGAVLLKPLSRAIADGDRVYCVIRGTAMNNNGASAGLTRPDEDAQRGLLTAALRRSGVAAEQVQYVELHGTGTPLGDRVEAAALGSVLGAARPAGTPLPVGSVKTNLGHLEGAAGITGLIKTALVLTNRTLPPSLHFRTPPPEIPLEELNLRVQTETVPWPPDGEAAIAGVSSFGMGGTNVHVVLGSGPSEEDGREDARAASRAVAIWPVSARTETGLRAQAERLHAFVREHPGLDPVEVGHALATTRTAFEHRAAVVGSDREALLDGLARLAGGQPAPAVPRGVVTGGTGRIAYLFPGQGSQRCGMGRELAAADPVFAAALDEVCAELDRHTALPVRRVMWAEPGSPEADLLDTTEYAQPALFAIGVALFRVLDHAGVRPDVVSGYSLGELTAAHVAGVLSLADAARLVALRGRLMQDLRVDGVMVAVRAAEDEVLPLLAGTEVELAAVNGPRTVVLTGPRPDVEAVAATLAERGHKTTPLTVSHPFHSAALDPMLRPFGDAVETVAFGAPRFEIVSTLTGSTVAPGEFRTPEYWTRQARETVRFADAVRATRAATFVELGPSGALTAMAADCVSGAVLVPLLRRSGPAEAVALATALGSLHTAGVRLDWDALAGGIPRHRIKLPTYAFERRSLKEAPAPNLPAAATDLDELVRAHAAAALGFADPAEVDPHRTFRALGFDSLTLVEFAAALAVAAGVPVEAETAYDHPTPAALAAHLRGETGDVALPTRDRSAGEDDPVVVVGMGCRLPGGVSSPEELWELVTEGRDVISGFPADRGWDVEALYSPEQGVPGRTYTRHGGFLHDAPLFDHEFFGISPREAAAMDPQQRLLLETTWEAVERAGIDPTRLRGTDTGVFVGVTAPEYGSRLADSAEDGGDGYALTGTTPSVASGRLAYVLGLHGPAITVDTACSSSLVAIHQAVRSLRSGECDLALAGGATVMSSPGMFVEFSRQRGLAPDGRCKAFAETADGTGWAEGVGVLVLERLSDARRNGHRVLAVIRGSAINSDGASNGLAAPSGKAQRRVISRALADAGLRPSDVDAVEAHGTGTLLGDPIEARAILATYGADRAEDRPLWLGSVKSNIGHTQAAAGVTGVIKMVLALNHGLLPRTLHADQPTTRVNWASAPVRLLTGEQPWPEGDRPRRAAVSSFGISGTNAHVVLEQAPERAEPRLGTEDGGTDAHVVLEQAPERAEPRRGTEDGGTDAHAVLVHVPEHAEPRPGTEDGGTAAHAEPRPGTEDGRVVPLVLSARTPAALRAQATLLRDRLGGEPSPRLADVAHSLLTTRTRFEHRAVVLAAGTAEAAEHLLALTAGEPSGAVVRGVARAEHRAVFVFPGQGSQWQGMAVELLDSSPVFRAAIARCERALSPWVDWSLVAVLRGEPGAPGLGRVDVVQPVLFAVMVSLAALWRAAGVEPAAVIGHSQGEIAAAHVAGALSIEDAARIIALRSKELLVLAGRGGMMFVRLPEQEAAAILPGDLAIATVNGPTGVVVAGAPGALERFASTCAALGVDTHLLPVDYASHSSHVESIEARLRELAAPVTPGPGSVPFYSAVTGARLDGAALDADYWYRNLRLPVRFDLAAAAALADGYRVFVEVSPHPVLTWGVTEIAEASDVDGEEVVVTGTLRRDEGGLRRFGTALAQAEAAGAGVDWSMFFDGLGPAVVELPTYPFQRHRHWPEARRRQSEQDGSAFWTTVASGDTAAFARLIGVAEREVPSGLVTALARWRGAESPDDCWYRIDWRAVPDVAVRPLTGAWALLAEPDDVRASALATRMRHAGAVVEVHTEVDAARLADTAGVVSLLAGREGLAALAAVLPVLAQGRLWCVTRGGVNTGDERPDPEQAMLWGFGRVAALEHPARWGGLADLTADPDDRALDRLCALLAAESTEDQLAIRPAGTFARRLARRPRPTGRWRPRGTVLVVGGTGAVGRPLARFLAEEGAEHLVLVSRSGPRADGAEELRAELTALGAEVSIVACDAADRTALAEVLDAIPERYPLTAVVHAAMVLRDGTIDGLTPERIAEVLRPKIDVALNLHELTLTTDLDAFVLFSSVASITGAAGSAAYAAANAFVDALAEQRRADGLPALSIAWGLWAGTAGFAGETMQRRGLRGMDFTTALDALRAAAGSTATSVFVADVDWPGFTAQFTGSRPSPLLADFTAAETVRAELPSLATAPMSRRPQAAMELVREHAAAVLGRTGPDAIPATTPFRELGFDSLMAVELRNRLGGAIGRALPATLVFSHPTAASVAELLLSLVPPAAEQEQGAVSEPRAARSADDPPVVEPEPASLAAAHGEAEDGLPVAVKPGPAPRDLAHGEAEGGLPVVEPESALLAAAHGEAEDSPPVVEPESALLAAAPGEAEGGLPVAAKPESAPRDPAPGEHEHQAEDDPIAIVGIGCRLPGDVRGPDEFWELLLSEREVLTGFPQGRGWDEDDLYDPDPDAHGKTYVRTGAFLADADRFDAAFFGISPREALCMDPQQRVLLETAWEALEHAGVDPRRLRGSRTGVFVGATAQEYGTRLDEAPAELDGLLLTGMHSSVMSGRISYVLGLEGPALTIDTACSSSLVSIHVAAQSLRSGECELALAGGVTVMARPGVFVQFSRQRGLAPDGRCKPFAAAADGTGWAEGAGVLVLERLSAARRHGHRVLAVLRSSAVNQDGASNGLSAPSGPAQERVIRQALANGGLRPSDVDAVEAHGTGTALGDPIEAQALVATYGQDRVEPLWLGSLKSNIAHPQAAAGVAGVIKAVLAIRNGTLPRTLNVDAPTPHVDWSAGAVRLLTEALPWPETGGRPRRMGVSAFGVSGTNAHAVIEEYLQADEPVAHPSSAGWTTPLPVVPWVVSAHTEGALRAQAQRLSRRVFTGRLDHVDVGHSLATTRTSLRHRAVALGADRAGLLRAMTAVASGADDADVVRGSARADAEAGAVFVFSGVGSHWAGMAAELMAANTVFARRIEDCADALAPWLDWSLVDVLRGRPGTPALEREDVAQCTAFSVMVALADLWRAHGVEPVAVLGQSLGEHAAACVSGALSLEDAARLVAVRSTLLGSLPSASGLVSVPLPLAEVEDRLLRWDGELAVAAIAGPSQIVVGGAVDAVDDLLGGLVAEGVAARRVRIGYASHTRYVEPVREEMLAGFAGIRPQPSRVPFISSFTGSEVDTRGLGPDYWYDMTRAVVRFEQATRYAAGLGHRVLVEVSPHPMVTIGMQQTLDALGVDGTTISTLRRGEGSPRRFLGAVARAHAEGVPVDWAAVFAGGGVTTVSLPTYPFQGDRYWLASSRSQAVLSGTGVPSTPADRTADRAADLVATVARLLGAEPADLDPHQPLRSMGLDSMMAMELKRALATRFGLNLPLVDIIKDTTLTALTALLGDAAPAPEQPEQQTLAPAAVAADPAARFDPFPLTDLQHAYLVGRTDVFDLGGVPTYYTTEVDLVGVDLDRLGEAFRQLIARHDMLRAVITPDGRQRVLEEVPPHRIEVVDLRDEDEPARTRRLAEIRAALREDVDATTWPWFDVRATLLDEHTTRLHVGLDILFVDGWSISVLMREWAEIYHGRAGRLPELPGTFRDHVLALRARADSPERQRAWEYWRNRLDTLPPAPELPLAPAHGTRRATPSFTRKHARLTAGEWQSFRQSATSIGVTPSAALCAAYGRLLATWSKSSRFTLTLLSVNRAEDDDQIGTVLGNFSTTTLLEMDSAPGDRFAVHADRVQRQLWEDLEHADVNGVEVLRELNRSRGPADRVRMPVVFASTLNTGTGEVMTSGIAQHLTGMAESGTYVHGSLSTPQVWLDHQVREEAGELVVNWEALDGVFPDGLIDAMYEAYLDLLRTLCRDESAWQRPAVVHVPAADLDLRAEVNSTAAPLPEGLLHDRFVANAAAWPDRVAVITAGRTLTYGELDRTSNRLARWLGERGAGPGTLVGIVMRKGWEQITAAVGVLKSGAAYVPIDADVPAERLRLLLADSGISLVVTQHEVGERTDWPEGVVSLAVDGPDLFAVDDAPVTPSPASPADLAYVIHTSGSTGRPKGVMIEHRAALNTIEDVNDRFGVTADDRALGVSAMNFDLSVYDVFGMLSAGGAIVLPEPEAAREPSRWLNLVTEHRVTVWNTVPALMEMFTEHALAAEWADSLPLRLVLLSGDWIPVTLPERVRKLVPGAAVWSLGGATEASIWSILHPVGDVDPSWPSIPYGTAMRNQRMHVFDEAFQPRPVWVPGQIHISGAGLARGYLGDEARTRAAFVRHPVTGERLYRTGDLGRFRPDGTIEFLGREDLQVKVQGYRIELGEVETALSRCTGVQSAVVTVAGQRHGAKRLVGYVVLEQGGDLDRVREELRRDLPAYLVPQVLVTLPALPLGANGKVVRSALPEPDAAEHDQVVLPRTGAEVRLARIWEEFFDLRPVSVTANFFELGGDSLLAVRLMSVIQREFGRALALSVLFTKPTIAELAEVLSGEDAAAARPALVPIRARGDRPPLVLVHPVGGDVLCYADLVSALGDDQPCFGLQVPDEPLLDTVEDLARHYADAVRTALPTGPLRFAGWSMGGVVALETARQLTEAGRTVDLVAMIDPSEPPGDGQDRSVDDAVLLSWFARDLAGLTGTDWALSPETIRAADSALELVHEQAGLAGVLPHDVDLGTFRRIAERFLRNFRALLGHRPEPYGGRVRIYRAADGGASAETVGAWLALCTGEAASADVPGDHYTAVRPPQVAVVAELLDTALASDGGGRS